MGTNSNRSELAMLLAQIEAENAAEWSALHDPSLGTARHDFITQRYNTIGLVQ